MITNKDISIDSENGKITLNGNKYDLGTQGEIDTAVKGVYSVMGQMGAKNLIPYPYYETTKTTNGITFTDNGDGSITVNGTATQNASFYLTPLSWNNEEIKGNVILSAGGVPFNSNFKLTVETPSGTNNNLQDNGELSLTITAAIKNIRLFVANGTTVDNVTIYPMIRLASDTDNTYEPYAMTNKQLTDQLGTKQDSLTFDTTPTDASTNPVTSGGVYTALSGKQDAIVDLSYSTTGLTPDANCTIKAGGYVKIGKLVVVNVRVVVTAAGATIAGFPIPAITDQFNVVGGMGYNTSDGSSSGFYINYSNGTLTLSNNVSSGDILFSFVYAAN